MVNKDEYILLQLSHERLPGYIWNIRMPFDTRTFYALLVFTGKHCQPVCLCARNVCFLHPVAYGE